MREGPDSKLKLGVRSEADPACMSAALRRTANLVTRVYNAYLAPAGLEVTQYSILRKIEVGAAGSASELAELVGVERSTLTRNLERLVSAGLVDTRPGEGRRIVHVLTPSGKAKIAAALPLWREAQRALLGELPASHGPAIHEELALLRSAARKVKRTS